MARKIVLHVDALIVIVLLFAAAVCFIAFQRYQYSLLLRDNVERQMKQLTLELEVARLEALLKRAAQPASGSAVTPKAAERADRK